MRQIAAKKAALQEEVDKWANMLDLGSNERVVISLSLVYEGFIETTDALSEAEWNVLLAEVRSDQRLVKLVEAARKVRAIGIRVVLLQKAWGADEVTAQREINEILANLLNLSTPCYLQKIISTEHFYQFKRKGSE